MYATDVELPEVENIIKPERMLAHVKTIALPKESVGVTSINKKSSKKIKHDYEYVINKLAKLECSLSNYHQLLRFKLEPKNMSVKVKVKSYHMQQEVIEFTC